MASSPHQRWVARAAARYSASARAARARTFQELLRPAPGDRILDLGSEDGAHIAGVVPGHTNITIADIDMAALERGRARFGFATALLDESGRLPFDDGEFDIVYCSSVIEHVTVPKAQLREFRTTAEFAAAAFQHQRAFADEIRRVGRRYFVQTPNRLFPIESHTWLPVAVVYLPRSSQIALFERLGRFWPKDTAADWNLLSDRQMRELFPDAQVVHERSFGFVKSLMAVRR